MLKKQLFIMQAVPASFLEMELFSPLPLVYKIKTKLKTIHWVYDCIQPLRAPCSKGSEKSLIKTAGITCLKTAEQQMYLPKWHVLTTSILQIISYMCLHTRQLHGT